MLNDEQAAVFARLIAECAGAAYGNHGVDTADAYRVLMAYIGDLLAAERDDARKEVEALREWLDGNTTFYDVDHAELSGDDMNVPVLAAVSRRIWYHATDDQASYPFSAVIDAAMKG